MVGTRHSCNLPFSHTAFGVISHTLECVSVRISHTAINVIGHTINHVLL